MKILIITLHSLHNPGSVLQAYALQKFLIRYGYNAKIIDYRPHYVVFGKNKLRGLLSITLFAPWYFSRKNKFEKFIQDNMKLTDNTYYSYDKLCEEKPDADVYIVGSDQLWNPDFDCGNDDAFFCGFVNDKTKIAYGTSIGKKDITRNEIDAIVSKIRGFQYISVRERNASISLSGALGRSIPWVCDPVLLLSVNDYMHFCGNTPSKYGKYAVVYLSEKSDLLDAAVDFLRNRCGLKVILLGGFRKRCNCNVHIKDMGPIDFLILIKNATVVVSSSFHATVFSHVFHKKFGVILPKGNSDRMECFLELTGQISHVLNNESDFESMISEIDYAAVDSKIDDFINNSKQELLNALLDCTNDFTDIKRRIL